MSFKIITKQIRKQILAFVENLVNKNIYKDIDKLLNTCCKPTLSVTADDFACTGDGYTVFNSVTVNTVYKDQKLALLFVFTDFNGDEIVVAAVGAVTDSNGNWTGNVVLPDFVDGGNVTITLGVITLGSQVVVLSEPITVTGVPNCD